MGYQDLDTRRVAVGVLHIMARRALVEFPGSTRSHPAPFAVVSLLFEGALLPQWKKEFPFKVPWDLWQHEVVPVLKVLQLRGTLAYYLEGGYPKKLAEIEAMLRGTLPGSPEEEAEAVGILNDEDSANLLDSDSFWSDGTPKKVYPNVE